MKSFKKAGLATTLLGVVTIVVSLPPQVWADPPKADLDARLAALSKSFDSELSYRDLS